MKIVRYIAILICILTIYLLQNKLQLEPNKEISVTFKLGSNQDSLTDNQTSQVKSLEPESKALKLASMILDKNANMGDRYKALFSLKNETSSSALFTLEQVVLSPIESGLHPMRLTEELVLRAQAIEFLHSPKTVIKLLQRIDQAFLADRLHRQLEFLRGRAPAPEIQDRMALHKFLEEE